MRLRTPLILACLAAVPLAHAASPFRTLADLDDLPYLRKGVRTLQVASTDPSGGNGDAGHFVRVSGRTAVLADLQGPGIVTRIWSANPSGRLRIYVDDPSHPVVDAPFADLFSAKVPGFLPPIASTSSGGFYSYVPIAFRKSCLITVTDGTPFYYQVTWSKLPDSTGLAPFNGHLSETDKAAYATALQAWNDLGANRNTSRSVTLPRRTIDLPPGGRWAQPIQGPGTITELRFQFPAEVTFSNLRQIVLRITFDGSTTVRAPLADFFGIGFDGVEWKSLPLGYGADGAYCFFRMPFRKTARIELENQGRERISASFTGSARPGALTRPWGYFHADYHTAINTAGLDYTFARLRGAGHVVGVTESMRGTGNLWFLEGDEHISVDGEATPSIKGTGTEDFYNCGWYFNAGLVNVALHGVTHKTDNEIGAYRFLVPDAIPFTKSLDFRMEHGGTDDAPGTEYASVTYWYGATGAKDLPWRMPTGAALLPRPYIAPVEGGVQAMTAAWRVKGGTLSRQSWQQISPYRGGGRALLKGKAGASMSVPLDVRFTDRYDVDLYFSGANTGSMAALQVDGADVGKPVTDGTGPLPLRKVSFGPLVVPEGRHTFGLTLKSGTAIGLSALRLTPQSPLVKDFVVLGPFPMAKGDTVLTPMRPDGVAPDLSASFRSGARSVSWTVMRAPSGVLDLAATLTPNENVVAYASFAVKSPSARTMPMLVGSDDGVAVFLNGQRVFASPAVRGLIVDEDRVPLNLKAGWNVVVLKVAQASVVWAVTARIPDAEGVLQFAPFAPPRER